MSAEENKAVVRLMYDAINEGGLHVLDQVLAPGYVGHFAGGRRHVRGREGLKQLLTAARGAFHDVRFAEE